MATRQNSKNGKPKSPRVQVVLPESLCERLTKLANSESRTVSNMAKVLIQEGVIRFETKNNSNQKEQSLLENTEGFRTALEAQQPKRLKGIPRKIRLYRPS